MERVDTELNYLDVEPNDEDEEDLDVERSSDFPINNLTDEINLTSITSNATNHSDHKSGSKVDLTTTKVHV